MGKLLYYVWLFSLYASYSVSVVQYGDTPSIVELRCKQIFKSYVDLQESKAIVDVVR